MPYRRDYEPVLRRPIASQESVPSSAYWRRKAIDDIERGEQEAYEREMYDWYLRNRGVQQPDGSYFGPEIGPRATRDQFGTPIGYQNIDTNRPMYRFGKAADDFLLGYDPREGAEGYEPSEEEGDAFENAMLLGLVPGAGRAGAAMRGVSELAFADYLKNRATGNSRMGALDVAFGTGLGSRFARNVNRSRKAFQQGFRQGRARKAYEEALRRNALPQPKVRRQNARTGRWDEVNAYPEFVPFEEVRF